MAVSSEFEEDFVNTLRRNKLSEKELVQMEIIIELEKENEEMKKKLSLMRHFIYGNYDLEYKEMQLKCIDEFGKPL